MPSDYPVQAKKTPNNAFYKSVNAENSMENES